MNRGLTITFEVWWRYRTGSQRSDDDVSDCRFSYKSLVEMGLRSHDLGTVFWRISQTNCSVTGVNVCGEFPEKAVLSIAFDETNTQGR